MPIGIAIIGAGIFARDEHFPAVQACPLFSLKAIYSRTEQSADILTKLANFNDPTVRAYSDNASTTGRTLNHLLHRKDIEAVIIALPIHVQPEIIKRAISAGKHVLSEKPIAKDTETAIELVRWYKREPREEIWSVGEKFRFLASMKFGAEQLGRIGGEVITLSVKVFGFVDENDKYFQSKWCKSSFHQSGFLLYSGVQFIAGLRYLLSGTTSTITQISAFTSLLQPALAPHDTLHSIIKLSNGNAGTFALSLGADFLRDFSIEIITSTGAVTVGMSTVTLVTRDAWGNQAREVSFEHGSGVGKEVEAFAEAIEHGEVDPRGSAEQAFLDLRLLESMLESGREGGAVKVVSPM